MKRFRLLVVAVAALSGLSIPLPALPAREFSYADRLRAQEAIERVYYAHQVGATKPFEEAVPKELIRKKVRTTLRQSVALETYWSTPVTDVDLAREVDRMIRTTRMPDRLRELFAALGNDPLTIRECLARPALVSRLLRNFYAFDPRMHAPARGEAEALGRRLGKGPAQPGGEPYTRSLLELVPQGAAESEMDDEASTAGKPRRKSASDAEIEGWRRLAESPGGVGEVREERQEFVVPVLLEDSSDAVTLALYSVPKKPLETWWKEVEAGLEPARARTGRADALVPGPTASAVTSADASCAPVDTWDETSLLGGVPLDRWGHTTVWTGSVMLVWGGHRGDNTIRLNSGGRYDPATDTWETTSTVGAPEARSDHTAIWTGSRMIVWGGSTFPSLFDSGGQYDPVSDSWIATQSLDAPVPRAFHTAVWTGSEMLVWGGKDSADAWLGTGGRYNPDTNSWLPMSTAGAPAGRAHHVAVWAGTKMIVWGGQLAGANVTNTGGRYDPSLDTWETTSTAGAPSARSYATAVSTGTSMIVWSGGTQNTGGQYDPVSDGWTATSTTNAPVGRDEATSIWTGTHMIVWGGRTASIINRNTGGRYDPATNTWAATSTTGAPWGRWAHSAV